jgi:hypothetical protein
MHGFWATPKYTMATEASKAIAQGNERAGNSLRYRLPGWYSKARQGSEARTVGRSPLNHRDPAAADSLRVGDRRFARDEVLQ